MRLMRFTRVCRRMRAPCTESRRSVAEFSALNQNLPSPGLDRNPRLDLACSVKLVRVWDFPFVSPVTESEQQQTCVPGAEARIGMAHSRQRLTPCPTAT